MNVISADDLNRIADQAYQIGLALEAAGEPAGASGDTATAARCEAARSALHFWIDRLWVENRDQLLTPEHTQPIAEALGVAVEETRRATADLAALANALNAVSQAISEITKLIGVVGAL